MVLRIARFIGVLFMALAVTTSWTPENIPDTWMLARNRYYLFTAIRTGFSIIGFCSFSLSVLFDTPQYRVLNRVSK